jgi:23S rRNA (adenine-N6)-dimethyltransferase
VLDLGAGGGRLTAELARAARSVVAVELDPRWAHHLRARWANVDVVHGDVASVQLPQEPFRVVANLPFDRTNDVLRHLFDDPGVPLVRADLIVEWGVAVKRGLPWPSTLNGAFWGAWYSSSVTRRLPRSVFDPRPSVDAGVLVLDRRESPLVPEACWRRYRSFVAAGFRHGLRAVAPWAALRRLRLTGLQARDLDAHQWAALFSVADGRAGRR